MAESLAAAFDREIETDLKWRQDELLSLKLAFALSTTADVKSGLLRALICLLYAHFEGYCKYILQVWSEVVTRRCVRIDELKGPYQYMSLRDAVLKMQSITDGRRLVDAVDATFAARSSGARIGSPLSTSNLRFDVLAEALESLCLQSAVAAQHSRRIDLLVSRRNDIAHGRMTGFPTLEAYQEYEEAIMLVMIDVALLLSSALQTKAYLK